MSAGAFDRFLGALRSALHIGPSRTERLAAEVRDHFACAAEELAATADAPDEIEGRVIERFGSAEDLAREINATDTALAALGRRITVRHLTLTAFTSAAAVTILLRALADGFEPAFPILLSSSVALLVLAHGVYAWLRPYSVVNCAAGPGVALLGVFVMICRGLFAWSMGLDYDVLILVLGVLIILQGSLSALTAYDHPLCT
jgi:hypothetical protein